MSVMSAPRARVCLARLLFSANAEDRNVGRPSAKPSLLSASSSSRPAGRVMQTRPPSSASSTLTRRAFRIGAREKRAVPRAARDRADGEAASRASARTSDEPTSTETPVSFSLDEDEASAGEGSSGHDVVRDVRDSSEKEARASPPTGWNTKPTSVMPSSYFRGEVGYSKFYPPEARDYEYKRKLMVAVDGSAESERAVEWAIQHLCRSGDLLHIVHCCLAGAVDPRLASYYDGPSIMSGDQIRADPRLSARGNVRPEYPERFPKRPMYDDSWAPTRLKEVRDAYFSAAVLRTEAMLDNVYEKLKANHGETADGGDDMTPFPQPVELDAVLDTTWEPIADMIKRKAEATNAEMLVVAHHSKKWWEEALAGSVAKYLVDHTDLNVVVVH